ncbi:Kelch 1 domain containing protein [Trichuris trichiura]|uniref:Kelch 1 domain containing protein n=1 Tax=Trichuris trichiura TaxID=36087 RepID=A0A077ZG96_TRITR|nr:Kelch 1 domain containing protein [Trichuris trichiura]
MDVEEVPTYKFTILEAPPSHSGLPRRPQPRSGHRMVSFDELIISVGGYSTEHSENGMIKEIWIMNPHTESWRPFQTTGCIPENLASHAMVRIGYSIVLFGGADSQ